jgi:hypothetical protein
VEVDLALSVAVVVLLLAFVAEALSLLGDLESLGAVEFADTTAFVSFVASVVLS